LPNVGRLIRSRGLLQAFLVAKGDEVLTAPDGEEAFQKV